jgi:cell fate regulator YaaT (PSP1 superfamily)
MELETVEVQFKRERKGYYLNKDNLDIKLGDYVVVEVDRGEDLGRVAVIGELADRKHSEKKSSLGKIRRFATQKEIEGLEKVSDKEGEAFEICMKKVEEHQLDMKLVDTEWQFDGNKIIFYFTAEKRVDFRQLVKDLAAIFKTRIELKQIGVRDEARRLGGFGRCGYRLCCATFLNEFEPVTLRAAKEQKLSLNPSQISGICGRLMCCLMYERVFYKEQSKKFPKEGKEYISIEGREERVSGLDMFNEMVELQNREGFKRKISLEEFNKATMECPCKERKNSEED